MPQILNAPIPHLATALAPPLIREIATRLAMKPPTCNPPARPTPAATLGSPPCGTTEMATNAAAGW